MIRRVTVHPDVLAAAHEQYGEECSASGRPSEYHFVSGPLAAAVFAFRDFDALSYDLIASARAYTVVDPFFGVVDFVAVLTTDGVVEVVGYSDDPDYWATVGRSDA